MYLLSFLSHNGFSSSVRHCSKLLVLHSVADYGNRQLTDKKRPLAHQLRVFVMGNG